MCIICTSFAVATLAVPAVKRYKPTWTLKFPSIRCAFTGHEDILKIEEGKMYLECMSCGRVTSGWAMRVPTSVLEVRV